MSVPLIAAVVLVGCLLAIGLWLMFGSPAKARTACSSTEQKPVLPAEGLLVAADVLASAGTNTEAVWSALEEASAPVALEYYPVSRQELAKYRAVPVNAAAQQAMVRVVEAVNPQGPTLFRAVLPKGAELVKAVGADGFRGFSRTGGTTAHAVLKPVGVGGAIAAGWPVFAVAGTVMAIDMAAQREQRSYQRRVEASLGRQEERYHVDRIVNQRSADAQLSRAIGLLLDGKNPNLDLALKSAYDEFHRAEQFLQKYAMTVTQVVGADGTVDYRKLELALGGQTKEVDHFVRELHLARAAIAIRRKALVADAAAVALADPSNPYTALRKFLETEAHRLEQADTSARELTERLMAAELTGGRHHRAKTIAGRQEQLRGQIASPGDLEDDEVLYLATGDGGMYQLLPAEEGEEPIAPEPDE